jgi:hypothetical protein
LAGGVLEDLLQVSKSEVPKILPEAVRTRSCEPSWEYQTRSMGPVARPARERSIRVLPI